MSAVSTAISWRNISNQDTVSFLHSPIHNPNVENYRKKETNNYQQDAANAKKLQNYLTQIKEFVTTGESSTHFFNKAELDLLYDMLVQVRGVKGQTAAQVVQMFSKPQQNGQTKHAFEQDMRDLNLAIADALTDEKWQTRDIVIQTGQFKTNIFSGAQDGAEGLLDDLNQQALKAIKNNSMRKLPTYEDPNKKQSFRILKNVDGKVDMVGLSVDVTASVQMEYAHLSELNNLFKDATFTLKNYSKESEKTKIGNTNIFRVVYTLTQYFTGMSNQETLAYTSALAIRHATDAAAQSDVDSHLGHLQRVYQLTGLGQEYVNVEQHQLKELLRQGAKYMIQNIHNSSEIDVASTKELLYIMLNKQGSDHFSKTVKMARSIFQKIEAAN